MAKRKDYIGPTFNKHKIVVVPQGPVAELNSKTTKGMAAAGRLLGGEEPKIEGTPVKTPLRMGPPIDLGKKPVENTPAAGSENGEPTSKIDPSVVLGTSHITSYQTLLANDKLAKPPLKAWTDTP